MVPHFCTLGGALSLFSEPPEAELSALPAIVNFVFDLDWVTWLFLVVMFGLFIWISIYASQTLKVSDHRVNELQAIINAGQGLEGAHARQASLDRCRESDDELVRLYWKEFDETLIYREDSSKVHNTVDAEYFFNGTNLAPELESSKSINAMPGVLTVLGVLGTFVGLVLGLAGLDLRDTTDVVALQQSINKLITGTSTAFVTSLVGVFLSLISSSIVLSRIRSSIDRKIVKLQKDIDDRYARALAEESLIGIHRNTVHTVDALNELHEKIGTQFQTALQSAMSEFLPNLYGAMEEAMTTAMSKSLAPTLNQISTYSHEQTEKTLHDLIDRFSGAFTDLGTTQAEALSAAGSAVNASVASMSERFEQLTSQLAAQSETNVETLQTGLTAAQESQKLASDLVEQMHKTAEELLTGLNGASEHTSRASRDLRLAADIFGERSRSIEEALGTSSQRLTEVSDEQKQAMALLNSYADRISSIGTSLGTTSEEIRSAAEVSRLGYSALEQHQTTFLEKLESKFNDMSRTFESRVDSSNSTMNKWLTDYSSHVKAQTDERMTAWNDQTRDFSSNMIDIVNSLAEVVEEAERNGRAFSTKSA